MDFCYNLSQVYEKFSQKYSMEQKSRFNQVSQDFFADSVA